MTEINIRRTNRWEIVKRRVWRDRWIYMMVVPVLIYFFLLRYLPMAFLRISLYDYKLLKGFEGSKFVGLKWYEKMFANKNLLPYILNTLKLNIWALVVLFPAPVIFAILINELRSNGLKKTVQTASYLPHFISTVVLVSMIRTFISPSLGTLSYIVKQFGGTSIDYLNNPDYFVNINVISGVWQTVGWDAVIYIAALSGIDQGLYEAARIDGANRFRQILHVTLPGLAGTFITLLILQMGKMMSVRFDKVYLLQTNLNLGASEMLSTWVYKLGMEERNYSYGTAVGLFNSVVNVVLVFFANAISRRASDTSLF